MISYSLFYFSFFCLIFSSIHIFFFFFHFSFFFCSCFSPPHTYTHSPLYLQLFHFCFCFSTSLHNTQQLSLFLSLLSLSSLLFLLFYFLYSWQYIVNFSPHTSCIILQLHRPSQTKVHNMKNLIWERERERERERAGGEQKPYGSLSFLSFFFLFFLFFLISFGLWENLILCLDCVLHFVAIEIKKKESEEEREMEERGKNHFSSNRVIILRDKNV